eukprot:comp19897_c0_seq1/m.24114 comp19897_c0_seq1/g.24114  ORF comp19897_c0_seq1/g.24114 comp19897_c0_seq1/m.24114 type:complete len:352 (-) comp19897_c0_seq1:646-1701(-)
MQAGARGYYQTMPAGRPTANRFWSPTEYEQTQQHEGGGPIRGSTRYSDSSPTYSSPTYANPNHPYPHPHQDYPLHSAPVTHSKSHLSPNTIPNLVTSPPGPPRPIRAGSSSPIDIANRRGYSRSPVGDQSPTSNASGNNEGTGSVGRYRDTHIMSEQKRRNNIKDGFDGLQQLVPGCPPNATKADILRMARDHITHLQAGETGRSNDSEQVEELRRKLAVANGLVDSLTRQKAQLAGQKDMLAMQVEQLRRENEELLRRFGIKTPSPAWAEAHSRPDSPDKDSSRDTGDHNSFHYGNVNEGEVRRETGQGGGEIGKASGNGMGGSRGKRVAVGSYMHYYQLSPVSTGVVGE